MKRFLLKIKLCICFLLILNCLFAYEYKITSNIIINNSKYKKIRLIFNNYFVIENIKFYKDGALEFPYSEYKNRKYPQVLVLDSNLEKYIISFIKNYKEEKYSFDLTKVRFRTNEIQDVNSKVRKANIELIIDEKFLIILGIMKTSSYWISWPGFEEDGYYHKYCYILNKNLKDKIEQFVLKKYFEYRGLNVK